MALKPRKVRWMEMFPDELLRAIREYPVCYCAYGLAEPHGSYNAIGLDWIKAQALVERAARAHGGVVAPPCAWHVAERPEFDFFGVHGVKQPLASSISPDLFLHLVLYQIRAIDARDFHAGILVTGHYGGLENDMRLLCEYYQRRTGSPLRLRAFADWELIRFEDYRGDHAGICETSQLMALRPKLVDLDRKEDESQSGPWIGHDFPLSDGRIPSRELGENIVSSQIACLGEIQKEMLESFVSREKWRAPSLNDTEDMWNRFEHLTRKYWVMSMTFEEWKTRIQGKHNKFPGWEALGEKRSTIDR